MAVDVCLAVQEALSYEERKKFLANTVRDNPRLQGAKVADVLDILCDHNTYLDLVEPMYEAHHHATNSPQLIGICTRAIAVVYGTSHTTWGRVALLVAQVDLHLHLE
jgi:hypothetical protein